MMSFCLKESDAYHITENAFVVLVTQGRTDTGNEKGDNATKRADVCRAVYSAALGLFPLPLSTPLQT